MVNEVDESSSSRIVGAVLRDNEVVEERVRTMERCCLARTSILVLAESFKIMNRPDPTVSLLTAYFSENIEDRDVKCRHNTIESQNTSKVQ